MTNYEVGKESGGSGWLSRLGQNRSAVDARELMMDQRLHAMQVFLASNSPLACPELNLMLARLSPFPCA